MITLPPSTPGSARRQNGVPMSTSLLSVIPTDPSWTPDEEAAAGALAVLQQLAPDASEVTASRHDEVTFVDQGGNFDSLRCPTCGVQLEIDWWHDAMDTAATLRFRDLAVRVPCCGARTSLNDLDYRSPAGFARFVLVARDPGRGEIATAEVGRLAAAIGHPVRVVWASY